MRLQFRSQFLSIEPFDDVDIPDFMVLTGVNGSGKSHLLEAIEKRHVVLSGMEQSHVVRFNYETFKLENEGQYSAAQIASEREAAWQFIEQNVINNARAWRSGVGAAYDSIRDQCLSSRSPIWEEPSGALEPYRANMKSFLTQQGFRENPNAQFVYALARTLPFSVDELSQDKFEKLYRPIVLKNDFLPHQLGKVFWDYYVKQHSNEVNEYQSIKYGKNRPFLTAEEFTKTHGPPPWDAINAILKQFDTLKYRVKSPESTDYFGSYHLRLLHTENEALELEFSQLSSGERVLMALVACVYKAASDRSFPDLLLLDEVDASLHPSMMKNMLDVIDRVFLKNDVRVILVTHSPTMLALASEASVFVMNRKGRNRIQKAPKRDALAILTEGFVTLEEGVRVLDDVARNKLTLITEGGNVRVLERVFQLRSIGGVRVLGGIESSSGKNQLNTLFDFFTRVQHKNPVLFVWDCDVQRAPETVGNTFAFVIPENPDNTYATRGIENALPQHLLEPFLNQVTRSNGTITRTFDTSRKRDLVNHVIAEGTAEDFRHFDSLVEMIASILR
jgi:predicted ATPase